jgi:hypothetical protein
LNAKLPLLDQYGSARDASRKYSAAFEGHKNIVAQVFVIYVLSSFKYTLRIVDGDRDGFVLAKQRYSMCYLLSNSIALTKGLFRCKIQEEDFNKPIGERSNFSMHTELDDEQMKFITDSV